MPVKGLPNCLCGRNCYESNGGSYPPSGSTSWYACQFCTRRWMQYSLYGDILITTSEVQTPDAQGMYQWPEDSKKWFDTNLELYLRNRREQGRRGQEQLEQEARDAACNAMGLPLSMKFEFMPLDPAKPEERTRVQVLPDGTVISEQVQIDLWDKHWHTARREITWENIQQFMLYAVPAQIPESLVVFLPGSESGSKEAWERVSYRESDKEPMPVDPTRQAHDKYFEVIFEKVGIGPADRVEIPNRYYKDTLNSEPWYEFTHNNRQYVIGPRKRVVSINVFSDKLFDITAISALAERDQVTFEADGQYKSKAAQATSVLIHAWNQETAVEYLTALILPSNALG